VQYKEKNFFLHFWHGLGGYGYRTLPSMKTLYDTYHSLNVEFVTLANAYSIRSYPELIVIDSKGTIVACSRNVEVYRISRRIE